MHVHVIQSNKGGDEKHSIPSQSFYIDAPKHVLGCIGRHTGFGVSAVLLFLQLYMLDFYKSIGAAAKVIYTPNTHTHTHACVQIRTHMPTAP